MNGLSYYISEFPESLYPTIPELRQQYQDRVISGYDVAANSSCLIAGICRDVETILPYTIARIEKLRTFFKYSEVFVYENDSIDKTEEGLHKWASNKPNVFVKSEKVYTKRLADQSEDRRRNMAYARNKYLAHAYHNAMLDYLIVVDFDLAGGFSYHGVLNSISYLGRGNGSCIASNSILYRNGHSSTLERLFYDAWAFRRLGRRSAHDTTEINAVAYNRGEELVRVLSAFGGLAIYSAKALRFLKGNNMYYTWDDCDHVTINRELTDAGHLVYLNPSMITLYSPTEYLL